MSTVPDPSGPVAVAPTTRRAILAGAIGAAIASVAAALGRPAQVEAVGETVLVGYTYTGATAPTTLDNSSGNSADVFEAATNGSGSGVLGTNTGTGSGVYGVAFGGAGVFGYTPGGPDTSGVRGVAYSDGTGVAGSSSGSPGSISPAAKTGVHGYAAQDGGARGVFGQTTLGRGVQGTATTGVAGYFNATYLKTGTALRAVGRVRLDNCAGIATVASGQTSKVVTPGIDITSTSAVVATVLSDTATSLFVRRIARDPVADTFTIHISGSAPGAGLKVAWHVFG